MRFVFVSSLLSLFGQKSTFFDTYRFRNSRKSRTPGKDMAEISVIISALYWFLLTSVLAAYRLFRLRIVSPAFVLSVYRLCCLRLAEIDFFDIPRFRNS